jgi:hypothetical protein
MFTVVGGTTYIPSNSESTTGCIAHRGRFCDTPACSTTCQYYHKTYA